MIAAKSGCALSVNNARVELRMISRVTILARESSVARVTHTLVGLAVTKSVTVAGARSHRVCRERGNQRKRLGSRLERSSVNVEIV